MNAEDNWFIELQKTAQNLADYYGVDYESAFGILKRGADLGLQRAKDIVRETEVKLTGVKA